MLQAVDCQGFAGAFTYAVVDQGFELVGKRELPGGFGVASCEGNRHLLPGPWETEVTPWQEWSAVNVPLVFGNPPCSGFSGMTASQHRGIDAKVNSCMWALTDYAARCGPEMLIFESVQQAFTKGRPLMQALRARLEDITGDQYDLVHVLHNGYGLGGCAMRPRYFYVATKVPFGVDLPDLKQEDLPTLRDAIGDLEDLELQWDEQPYLHEPSAWSKEARRDDGYVCGHARRESPGVRRVLEMLESVEWHPGESFSEAARRYYERFDRLPATWSPGMYRGAEAGFRFGFRQPRRWKYDVPARTVTGGTSQSSVHPTELRTLTVRECARIQGFPDDWRIAPIAHRNGVFQWWGKGIAVACGKWIAANARESLNGAPGSIIGEEIGDRERRIQVTHRWKELT